MNKAEFNNRLGWTLRSKRRTKKIGLEEIADKLGVSYQQVQKYETGANQISAYRFSKYCQILGERPEWILGLVDRSITHDL